MIGVRKVRIHTFGCQMNVYDSEHMLCNLAPLGFQSTLSDEDADLIILNTCSVREKAAAKVFSLLGRLKRHKRSRPGVLLAVAGCVAQQEQEELARRVPYVDIVLGPDQVPSIAELVEQAERTGGQVVATRFLSDPDGLFSQGAALVGNRVSAFVTVMKGCNQFCSYCIVPYTRGRESSKPADAVESEVRALVDSGVREIFLLGQNVNRYGMDREGWPRFSDLLRRVSAIEGVARLRFTTSHPADCTDDLVCCFAELPNLAPYFHLPLQSGSDSVLARMNRRYDLNHYRGRIERLRAICPGIHLSTDLIVGFPGETDEEFEATLRAARDLEFGSAFSFKYSPRPGTKAALLADDVPDAVKAERLEKLQAVLYSGMARAMGAHVGRIEPVLVEGSSVRSTSPGQATGRTGTNYVVNFDVPGSVEEWRGRMVPVRITAALPHSLAGEPLT
ncbi:MAG: tRNA (N6-isopentenyl adenosine(37)-C2)-methylthiotransferase MiaB [Deltaproteobacteria bacterium]|nr:tRNA (N6-isopentenyl adenosine(37)-C2)-methylthiotransferase MiaB [Deltaproteobacteria bacterium]